MKTPGRCLSSHVSLLLQKERPLANTLEGLIFFSSVFVGRQNVRISTDDTFMFSLRKRQKVSYFNLSVYLATESGQVT